jgi:hypothetical protein
MKRLFLHLVAALLLCTSAYGQQSNQSSLVNTLAERIQLSGYGQAAYTFDDTQAVEHSMDVKRIIFIANGTITDKWTVQFMYNFNAGGTLFNLYTDYALLPGMTVRFGQFKTPLTIESPMSPTSVELIDCYSQATNYLTASTGDPLIGSQAGRDMGLMLHGRLFDRLNYQIALMNGQGINVKDGNSDKDLVGNLELTLLDGWMVGVSGAKGTGHAIALSTANPDITVGEDYRRDRWAMGTNFTRVPWLKLRAEYMGGTDGTVKSEGYYATATCKVAPKVDVIASYDYFNKNKKLNMEQTNYVIGLQYWFYPKCRMQAQYTLKDNKLTGTGNAFQAQVQVCF